MSGRSQKCPGLWVLTCVCGVRVSQLKAKKKKEAALEADKRKAQEDKVQLVGGCMGEGMVVEQAYK